MLFVVVLNCTLLPIRSLRWLYRCVLTHTPKSMMKDDKILEGGPDLAGRGVYREKMLPFFTEGPHARVRHSGPVCLWKELQRAAETAQHSGSCVWRLQRFQADTELHLFNTGTVAHVGPGINECVSLKGKRQLEWRNDFCLLNIVVNAWVNIHQFLFKMLVKR